MHRTEHSSPTPTPFLPITAVMGVRGRISPCFHKRPNVTSLSSLKFLTRNPSILVILAVLPAGCPFLLRPLDYSLGDLCRILVRLFGHPAGQGLDSEDHPAETAQVDS